jgi:hypothetical protein
MPRKHIQLSAAVCSQTDDGNKPRTDGIQARMKKLCTCVACAQQRIRLPRTISTHVFGLENFEMDGIILRAALSIWPASDTRSVCCSKAVNVARHLVWWCRKMEKEMEKGLDGS